MSQLLGPREATGRAAQSLKQWHHKQGKPPLLWSIWISLVFAQTARAWDKAVYPRGHLLCIQSQTQQEWTQPWQTKQQSEVKGKFMDQQNRSFWNQRQLQNICSRKAQLRSRSVTTGARDTAVLWTTVYPRWETSMQHCACEKDMLRWHLFVNLLLLGLEVFLRIGKWDAKRKWGLLRSVFQVIQNWWVSHCWTSRINCLRVWGESGEYASWAS